MSNQTPLNPDALEVAAKALYDHFKNQAANDGDSWPELEERDEVGHGIARDDAEVAVSAYLDVAQLVVNSVEELITTRVGLALANAAFNEGLSAGIRACNESLEGEPFVKPVSPYRSEVDE